MAKRTQTFIVAILLAVLLMGVLWPLTLELRSREAARDTSTLMVAKPSRRTSSDYKVRDALNYVSPGGIFYGRDLSGAFDSRINHVMAHTKPDDSKIKHSIFTVTEREDVLRLLDEAWNRRGPPYNNGGKYGRDVYDIPMPRIVGTQGERSIRIVMENNQPNIITAYPIMARNAQ